MPPPVGQSCANCVAFVPSPDTTPRQSMGECRINQPAAGVKAADWPQIHQDKWCYRWTASTGSSLGPFDVGAGYRGSNDAGQALDLSGAAWQLLAPTFASLSTAIGFELAQDGLLRLNNTNMDTDATVLIQVTGICSFRSSTNNEETRMTIGNNGTPDTVMQQRVGFRNANVAMIIPITGQIAMKNNSTVGLYVMSDTNFRGVFHDYDLLVTSQAMLSYGQPGQGSQGREGLVF